MQPGNDLPDKVLRWLNEQGYPTEFQVANIYDRHGFRVFQGYHVSNEQPPYGGDHSPVELGGRGGEAEAPREIDVLAQMQNSSYDHLIRVCHVIECKWSKDKPWVVLTSPHGQLAKQACVAQTMGNLLGSTILRTVSQDPDLHRFDLFSTPKYPGFGGRQVFSQGKDPFYSAMQSVVDVSMLLMAQSDEPTRPIGTLPRNTIIAFPTIVVDGHIFEACFDQRSQDMRVKASKWVRCHWRGARSWRLHATIDVVSLDHLNDFLKTRAHESMILLDKLQTRRDEVEKCFEEKSLDRLGLKSGGSGLGRIPALLLEAIQQELPDQASPGRPVAPRRPLGG